MTLQPNHAEEPQAEISAFDAVVPAPDSAVSQKTRQKTLTQAVQCEGVGLHSKQQVKINIKPAAAESGIVFIRTDVATNNQIPAQHNNVCDVTLSTRISNGTVEVSTIEHLMAAFALAHIDNAIVEIDGAEVPIMDGSSRLFLNLLQQAGLETQSAPRRILRILREVQVQDGDKTATLLPDAETIFEAEIDFTAAAIGRQSYITKLNGTVDQQVCDARTFCMRDDIEAMQAAGLALGGSLDNAVIVDDDKILNEGGLRSEREFVQHKILDAIGDMTLIGAPFIGRYRGFKAGHAMHHKLLAALFATPDAYEFVTPTSFTPHAPAIAAE